MPRRDEYGRFTSDDDDDRSRGSSRRGFAAMDPERRREIARMGGEASHGGRGRDWDDDERYGRSSGGYRGQSRQFGYDEYDDDYGRGSSRRGFASMDPDRQREIASMGGRASHGGQGRDWDDDDRYYATRSGGFRGGSRYDEEFDDDYGRGSSRRGFASMDPDRQREIASMGGRASHGGQGRDWDDDDRYYGARSGGGFRGSSRYDEEFDDDYGRGRGTSRRGFASMDPERQREIASMGGRASHGGQGRDWDDDDDDDRRGRRGTSRRGFAAMDPDRQREIASMGGRASHGGR